MFALEDAAFEYIATAPNLESLLVAGGRVSDDALLALVDARKLKSVTFEDVRVSQEAVDRFRKSRPDCVLLVLTE